MRRVVLAPLVGLLIVLAFAARPAVGQQIPGPQGPEEGISRRQLWLLSLPGERMLMRALVFRPPGAGPFPLAVINHGSAQNAEHRARAPLPEYGIASRWFLDRGYAVVVPQRPGHGETGGPYLEDQGRCETADYHGSGLATADSIQAAIDDMTAEPFVRKSGVVVVGLSAGGWGSLALASRNPKMVTAVINIAGGRGGRADDKPENNCAPDRLVAAAGEFGLAARIPTLWLYSENDSYFAPALSRRMYETFRNTGGSAEYRLLPPFGADGHLLINSSDAFVLWAPIIAKFLAQLGA